MSAARPRTEEAREAARQLLARFDVREPPVPIERIARSLGIRLQYTAFEGDLSGMAFITEGTAIAGVNLKHHPHRQRFTLAHELGHIQMHREALSSEVHVDKAILRRDPTSAMGVEPLEVEANAFASEFLIPRALLDAELAGRQLDLEDVEAVKALARRFKVSEAAMRYRLQL